MMRLWVTGGALLLATPVLAGDLDEVRARALCAGEALDAALVRGDVSAACSNPSAVPVPGVVVGVDGLATSTGGFGDVQRSIANGASLKAQPAWVVSPPYENGKLYGVGKGSSALEAFQKALVLVAAQLKVEVDAEMRLQQTTETVINKRGRVVSLTSSNRVDAASQMVVRGVVEDVQLVGQWVDPDGSVWVLAALDIAAIAAREDAVVAEILGLLADATERVRTELTEDVLDQGVLFSLAVAIQQVRQVGKTIVGEDAVAQWKSELRDFQDLAEDVANCVEIDGFIVTGRGSTPLDGAPVVRSGDRANLSVTCRGKPLANARFRVIVQGGMAQVPARVMTDAVGRVSIPFGEVFGSNVSLGLVHDVPGQSGTWWLDDLRPARTARLTVTASRPATVQVQVVGGSPDENALVGSMVSQTIASQWGATVVGSGALLTVRAKLSTGTQREVRGAIVIPSTLDLSVVSSGEPGVILLERRVQSGGVSTSPTEARSKAIRSLGQNLGVLQLSPVLDSSVWAGVDCSFVEGTSVDVVTKKAMSCLRFASGYAGADRSALLEVVASRLTEGLLPLSFLDVDVAALGTSSKTSEMLGRVEGAHVQCLVLLDAASFDPWVSDAVAGICEANRAMQRALRVELGRLRMNEGQGSR